MQSINEDIKTGQFKQMYLLYGEEGYLKRQYLQKLRAALLPEADSMNIAVFEGKNAAPPAIIDLAETLPFFADRRVLIIRDSGLFKHGGEALADYLDEPAQTSVFLFEESEVDKRSRLFKAVQRNGRAVEFAAQDENTLKRWILGMLKKEGRQLSQDALELFLEKTGTDMQNIRGELEKLLCYTLERDGITAQDVEAVCARRVSNQIFEMINAMANRQQKRALGLYYDLLALKEAPMRILFLIARQFNLLLQVKQLKASGADNKTISAKTGLHGFLVGKYAAQAAKFKTAALRQALTDCVEAEEAVKTGRMNDRMSVELVLVKYSAS